MRANDGRIRRARLAVASVAAVTALVLLGGASPAASATGSAQAGAVGAETDQARSTVVLPRNPGPQGLRGPVDDSRFVVGPGDRFAITVWIQDAETQVVTVTPEGGLVLPGVGTVAVAGKTLAKAKHDVREVLDRAYRNVEVDISLVAVRTVEVHVAGHVENPGTYDVSAMDVISTLIDLAGGLREDASRRDIRVRRPDGTVIHVDLVRYENAGDLDANPPILDGDLVYVPFAKQRVYIMGAVEAPGTYEFIAGDTIGTLLEIAGGLAEGARPDSVEFREFVSDYATRDTLLSLDDEGVSSWPLKSGDQIYIRFQDDEYRDIERVHINGEVRFPGPYGINEGVDRLRDVIERAGGLTEGASLVEARLVRTSGVEKEDREFERLKVIPVQDMSDTEYAYFKAKSRERKGQVVVNFAKLWEDGGESENVLLFRDDRITIPQVRTTVTVSGAVTAPGLVTYLPDMKADYYIERAGGYSSSADKGKTRVIKAATGEWERKKDAGVIVPGDEIWVPEKPDRDWWRLTRETVTFIASVAAIYLVIDTAANR